MKLLLDENVPVKLRYRFSERGIQVSTISEQKWNSKKNGELLQLMIDAGFTHLITFDSSLSFQQNLVKFPIPVIIITAPFNNYGTTIEMFDEIVKTINSAVAGPNIAAYNNRETK